MAKFLYRKGKGEMELEVCMEKGKVGVGEWCVRAQFCTVRVYWARDNLS